MKYGAQSRPHLFGSRLLRAAGDDFEGCPGPGFEDLHGATARTKVELAAEQLFQHVRLVVVAGVETDAAEEEVFEGLIEGL